MNVLKAFVGIQDLVDNTSSAIAPIGELSTYGLTFTKDKKEYYNTALPDYRLIGLSFLDDITGVKLSVPSNLADLCMNVVKSIRTYSQSRIPPLNPVLLIDYIYATYYNIVTAFEFNNQITYLGNTIPGYIGFRAFGAQVYLWVSNDDFCLEYADYEITVIPHLVDINDFTQTPALVKQLIANVQLEDLTARAQLAKLENPETVIRMLELNYTNPINPADQTKTYWYFLIYGANGDDIDAIKDAAIQYLTDHSIHNEEYWKLIFPDLWKRTEFTMVPFWEHMAIPDRLIDEGLYSSLMKPLPTLALLKTKIPFYTEAHIDANTYLTSHPYRTLGLGIINGVTNKAGYTDFGVLFPDYLSIGSLSLDFNRMELYTRNFLTELQELIITAERSTKYRLTNRKFRLHKRNNLLFVTMMYDRVKYLVYAKYNLLA